MGVYIIAQLKFTNVERYRRYQSAFAAVFAKFDGTLVVSDEAVVSTEGTWPYNKVVILYFPSQQAALAFQTSPEYQQIAVDRNAGADATVIIAKGIDLNDEDSLAS